jgi:cytochrome c peroxidase
MKQSFVILCAFAYTACGTGTAQENDVGAASDQADSELAAVTADALGKLIFNDTTLSEPKGQACASCHNLTVAFADARTGPTSQGATTGRFGVRNTPSIVYSSYAPPLMSGASEAGYSGGLFLDGRSPTLEDQAGGPLLNPLEMGNASKAAVMAKAAKASWASKFKKLYGQTVFNDSDAAFAHLTEAVAAFERVGFTKRFTSKYDSYLAGTVKLSPSEARGLALFEDPARGNCASCHLDKPAADGTPPLFTDFGYDNLGIPKNPQNPFYTMPSTLNPQGANYVDHGLSGAIINPRQDGKFKAPSLRNVALTAPYGHNGYFPDLTTIVQFYNTRDSGAWPAPEINFGLNTKDMGKLGLSDQDVADLVAFMKTLTDGYK